MAEERIKRSPSVNASIADLKNVKGRVAVIGTIVSKNKDQFTFIMDDKDSKILVITNDLDKFEALEEGKLVRVMGKVIGEGEDTELLSEIIQDFSSFDLNLWKRVQTAK